MPTPNEGESHDDYIERCIPMVIDEGTAKDGKQAAAICNSMWEEHQKKSLDFKLDDELKIGARHSQRDQRALQDIHDAAITLGAACPPAPARDGVIFEIPLGDIEKSIVAFGDAVKALGDGKVGGYLVHFGNETEPDLTGDFFTKDTDYGDATSADVYYQHGMDTKVGKRKLGKGTLKDDDIGIWIEAQLNLRDEYEKAIYALAEKGKLGWSSGTAAHLVDREPKGNAQYIKTWPLGLDASLTPTPAEPRNEVIPLKSYYERLQAQPPQAEDAGNAPPEDGAAHETKSLLETTEGPNMDDIETKVQELLDKRDAQRAAEAKAEAEKAAALKAAEEAGYKKAQEDLKLSKRGGYSFHKVTEPGLKDDEVKSFLYWIRTGDEQAYKAAMQGQTDSEGGFAVPDDFFNRIVAKRDEASVVRQIGVTRIGTSLDRVLVPVENVASTKFVVTAEEGTYDENEPTLGQVQITVHKFTKLIKISEELEADAKADFGGYLASNWGRSLAAAENYYYIVSGTGANEPQAMAVGGTLGRTTTNAASIVAADIHTLLYTMPDPYVTGMCLIMKRDVLGYIRALLVATPYAFADWIMGNTADASKPSPSGTIAGVPVYCTDAMVGLTTGLPVTATKTALLVNPAMYAVVEREGMTVSRNPWLYQATGQIGLFARYRAGGAVLQSEAILWMLQA